MKIRITSIFGKDSVDCQVPPIVWSRPSPSNLVNNPERQIVLTCLGRTTEGAEFIVNAVMPKWEAVQFFNDLQAELAECPDRPTIIP